MTDMESLAEAWREWQYEAQLDDAPERCGPPSPVTYRSEDDQTIF